MKIIYEEQNSTKEQLIQKNGQLKQFMNKAIANNYVILKIVEV